MTPSRSPSWRGGRGEYGHERPGGRRCRHGSGVAEGRPIGPRGDRSPLALANRDIGALPPAAKAEVGKRVGAARATVKAAIDARQVELERARDEFALAEEFIDVTLPAGRNPLGARHPLTTVMERICDVFIAMGYDIAEGPEAEAEWVNFDALNVPPDHPARTMQDTFYVTSPESGVVLRTQTSPIQIRAMLERSLPIYVVAPGRVYRTDALDATHTPVFHQVEGLAVDEGLTMGTLGALLITSPKRCSAPVS